MTAVFKHRDTLPPGSSPPHAPGKQERSGALMTPWDMALFFIPLLRLPDPPLLPSLRFAAPSMSRLFHKEKEKKDGNSAKLPLDRG